MAELADGAPSNLDRVLRIGFKFEGIQEAHFIIKGCNRDTAWFRMLDDEWPAIQHMLAERLYGSG